MNYKILTLSVCLSLGTMAASQAQIFPNLGGQRAGISGLTFLKNDLNPRSVGMSGASAAINGDAYSIYNNPAAAVDLKATSFAVSGLRYGAGITHSLASGIIAQNEYNAFLVSANVLSSGAMDVRTEFQPDGTGEKFYATNTALGFGYARALSQMFSFGIYGKYIHEQLAEYKANTIAVDMGFMYRTDYKDLRFSAVLQHFGSDSKLAGSALPNSYNRNGVSLESYPAPTLFKMGVSMRPYQDGAHSLLTSVQLNHPNDNAENIRLGVEYSWNDMFFARTGAKINVKGEKWPSFGFGYRQRVGYHLLRIDYGANPTDYLGFMHSVGVSFTLGKPAADPTPAPAAQ